MVPVTEPLVTAVPPPPPLDIWAIETSLKAVTAGAQECASTFYGYLFAANPEFREMFPPVMNMQNERLYRALVKIVSLISQPDRLARYLTQLGADHRKYGVRGEMYGPVGKALVRTMRHHSEGWDDRAEAAWGSVYILLADTMIAGAETASGPPWWRGRVLRHEMRAKGLAVLDIQTHAPYPYEPGQYLTLKHPKWKNVWRQYSIASPPAQDGDRLLLHVRQTEPLGWVSTALTRDTPDGSEVTIGPAMGTMTAEAADGRPLLLIAGGVGLAPLEALAEDVLARDEVALAAGWGMRRDITLFHGVTEPTQSYEARHLVEMEREYPWFQFLPVVSDFPGFTGLKGNVADVAAGYGNWVDREVFVAGPPPVIFDAVRGLREAGVDEDRVHYDEASAG